VDQNAGSSSKRRNEVSKDLETILVGPIVEDPAEVVDVCYDGLFGEEIAKLCFSNLATSRYRLIVV